MKKIELFTLNLSDINSLQDYVNKTYGKSNRFVNSNWLDIIRRKL